MLLLMIRCWCLQQYRGGCLHGKLDTQGWCRYLARSCKQPPHGAGQDEDRRYGICSSPRISPKLCLPRYMFTLHSAVRAGQLTAQQPK